MRERVVSLFRETFGREPVVLCRAPGRIEFIGNHTDYNGGTVLGAAVDRGVWIAAAPRTDGLRRFRSDLSAAVVEQSGEIVRREGEASWINYPLGVLAGMPVFGLKAAEGFEFAVVSDLPAGAGLSSSAALELASGLTFLELTGQSLDRESLVKLGRHAENEFVGVPCGILDQGVSGFGQKDHLVFIDCRVLRFATVPMPAGTHFWVFNTHTKHALVDGFYSARHAECGAAAKALGVALLADLNPAQLEAGVASLSPVVAKRARHVVEEIARVDQTVAALARGDLGEVGRLLTASHRSSQHLFENSTAELDALVDELERTPGVFGARLSGGGFGGAVMALTDDSFGPEAAQQIVAAYRTRFGAEPAVLHLTAGAGAEVVTGA